MSTRLVKFFMVAVLASILALSAFGLGFNVGTRTARPALSAAPLPTAAPMAIERAPQTGNAMSPTPTGVSVPGFATPQASPTKPQVSPSATPRPNAGTAGSNENLLDEALFLEVWKLLQKQFYGDLPEGKEITYDAIRGLVDRLGDQHTPLSTPRRPALQHGYAG